MPRSVQNFEQKPVKNRFFAAGTVKHVANPRAPDKGDTLPLLRPGHLGVNLLGYDPGKPTYPNESE